MSTGCKSGVFQSTLTVEIWILADTECLHKSIKELHLFTTTQGRKMLTDKVVLITGGAQGLGLAFSEILLEQDAKVI